ncbi:hypothetical protein QTP70_016452 [Hemibagrus guttatus]|uniref:Reverse transcriptase domain-containing protein n=1 Tax=Hemibagrus guttatus TaxID=175788 RepID=A0AAE0R810_9TELE|nr:hypothetical protein QTP70_016452 [Hemibagrus guttatus]
MWQGIQAITNYKTTQYACDSDASLPDALNDFYTQFEAQNNVAARKTIPPPNDQVLCLSTADVRRTLCRVNPRKSAGPDNIPGRVLRECAEQLADVFTDIFNISLTSAFVPMCLKTTTIIPMPKKSTISCLNEYRPIAITPIVMKCFERLVMRHIKTQLPPSLDRSTDDASPQPSISFNTIIPQHLIEKLSLLGLNTSLCNWILDFLTGRPQSVRIGNSFSSTNTLSIGVPQGCVLNPLLFTLMTHDYAAMHSLNNIVKFADDMTMCPNFFGIGFVAENFTWSLNTTSITKKAQQRLYLLRRLRKAHLPHPILTMFYRWTLESALSSCITASSHIRPAHSPSRSGYYTLRGPPSTSSPLLTRLRAP